MALHVHHGPQLAPLAAGLVQRLAAPAGDVFEPLVVAVPTAGVRDWLTRRLADDLGIAANIAMPFPGRFFADALGLAADDPWIAVVPPASARTSAYRLCVCGGRVLRIVFCGSRTSAL